MGNTLSWGIFASVIVIIMALDLGLLQRKAHAMTVREAGVWSAIWISLATLFGGYVYLTRGATPGLQYFTGYIIELSLSVDNVFLFAVVFSYFKVPLQYRHRVLFWGILSAVVMRGLMIWGGVALINRFHWIIYLFGGLLIVTGIKMLLQKDDTLDVEDSAVVRLLRRRMRITPQYHGQKFFTHVDGKLYATPLLLCLAMVEVTDVMFAIDSIPAIFAITRDPFIIFTSNIFAILGLRSLYFLLEGVMDKFHYLKVGLAFILMFVGFKMLGFVKIPIAVSLGVVVVILAISVIYSLLRPPAAHGEHDKPAAEPAEANHP